MKLPDITLLDFLAVEEMQEQKERGSKLREADRRR